MGKTTENRFPITIIAGRVTRWCLCPFFVGLQFSGDRPVAQLSPFFIPITPYHFSVIHSQTSVAESGMVLVAPPLVPPVQADHGVRSPPTGAAQRHGVARRGGAPGLVR